MQRLKVGDIAPDFTLPDHKGVEIRLADITHSQNVLLVFNLGFV